MAWFKWGMERYGSRKRMQIAAGKIARRRKKAKAAAPFNTRWSSICRHSSVAKLIHHLRDRMLFIAERLFSRRHIRHPEKQIRAPNLGCLESRFGDDGFIDSRLYVSSKTTASS